MQGKKRTFALLIVLLDDFFIKLKRLKLRKNNWESETYEFDEVLTEFASQKRVYEVVAKPVVEVCDTVETFFAFPCFCYS